MVEVADLVLFEDGPGGIDARILFEDGPGALGLRVGLCIAHESKVYFYP